MSKRANAIVKETIQRWRHTIMQEGPADVDGAKKLLNKVYPKMQVFAVDTPLQFYIAQAVIRKRISKKFAKSTACPAFGIDAGFIDTLKGIGRPLDMLSGFTWNRQAAATMTARVISANMRKICREEIIIDDDPMSTNRVIYNSGSRWRRRISPAAADNLSNILLYQTGDVQRLYAQFLPQDNTSPAFCVGRDHLNFGTNPVDRAILSLNKVVSEYPIDIVADDGENYDPERHAYDATQAEIICRLMEAEEPEITAIYELFHLVPAVMKFNGAFLLLANRPKICVNSEGNLHNDKGMAVQYQDGSGFWFLDGHILKQYGKEIVMAPKSLSATKIQEINNEEERRIAIDRYGWEQYMKDTGARVIDKRENWVDNTIEVLIDTPSRRSPHGYEIAEPLRAVLSCRSTGRRYVLSVPRETEPRFTRRGRDSFPITSCAMVQDWMANGAHTKYLEYAKLPVKIVGAS